MLFFFPLLYDIHLPDFFFFFLLTLILFDTIVNIT
jgi:hypothetical protein